MKYEITIKWYDSKIEKVEYVEKYEATSLDEVKKLVDQKWYHGADVSIYIPSKKKSRGWEYYKTPTEWSKQTDIIRKYGVTYKDYLNYLDKMNQVRARWEARLGIKR